MRSQGAKHIGKFLGHFGPRTRAQRRNRMTVPTLVQNGDEGAGQIAGFAGPDQTPALFAHDFRDAANSRGDNRAAAGQCFENYVRGSLPCNWEA